MHAARLAEAREEEEAAFAALAGDEKLVAFIKDGRNWEDLACYREDEDEDEDYY